MPSRARIPFWGGFRFLINPLKQNKGTLFNPRLLGNLEVVTVRSALVQRNLYVQSRGCCQGLGERSSRGLGVLGFRVWGLGFGV